MTASWHIVRSVDGPDKSLRDGINKAGYELYEPMRRVERPIAKRFLSPKHRRHHGVFTQFVDEPLFSPYFFMRFDRGTERWQNFREIFGIGGIGILDGAPAPADDIVKGLKELEVDGKIPGSVAVKALPFRKGEKIRVIDGGAFTGLSGTVGDIDEKGNVDILLEMMGREVTIANLRFTDLEKVSA